MRKNVVVIEATGLSKTKLNGWTEEKQLKAYAKKLPTAKIAVLTNGQSWYLYDLGCKESFGVHRGPNADIFDDPTAEAARTLHRWLNRRKLWRPN